MLDFLQGCGNFFTNFILVGLDVKTLRNHLFQYICNSNFPEAEPCSWCIFPRSRGNVEVHLLVKTAACVISCYTVCAYSNNMVDIFIAEPTVVKTSIKLSLFPFPYCPSCLTSVPERLVFKLKK